MSMYDKNDHDIVQYQPPIKIDELIKKKKTDTINLVTKQNKIDKLEDELMVTREEERGEKGQAGSMGMICTPSYI